MSTVNITRPHSGSFCVRTECDCCKGNGETLHRYYYVKYNPERPGKTQVFYKRLCPNPHRDKLEQAVKEIRTSVENWNFEYEKNSNQFKKDPSEAFSDDEWHPDHRV